MPTNALTDKILRLPLDLTGTSTDNFVEGEVKQLPNKQNRAVVLSYGPFFTESVVVKDNLTGGTLTKGVDYIAAQLLESATVRTGKEVCSLIIVTNQSVSDEIIVNYQAVGGPYILSVDALIDMIAAIDIDNRPISWGEIIGKPDLFPPGHHLHDMGDVYGFEYLVLAVEEVRKAIIMGDTASHDEIMRTISQIRQEMIDLIANSFGEFANHLQATDNPHQTNKEQVGLGNLFNYPIAETADAKAGLSNKLYMTPLRTAEAIAELTVGPLTNLLKQHTDRTDNPHQTNKEQVGLGNVNNFPIATEQEAIEALSNSLYLTPLRAKQLALALDFSSRYSPIEHHHSKLVNGTGTAILDSAGNFVASGDVSAFSDERLKEDIVTITNAVEMLKKVNGCYFTKKASGLRNIGVIAQNVQEVFPELVIENPNGYLSVAYGNFSGVLIEAVKELSTTLENTNNRLVACEEAIAKLTK